MNPFFLYAQNDKERFPGFSDYEEQREGTTFFADFSVAEPFGLKEVKETFNRAFKNWKDSYKYLTELTLVLNHKCWQTYETNKTLSQFYCDAFKKAQAYGYEHFKDDELKFFHGVLD